MEEEEEEPAYLASAVTADARGEGGRSLIGEERCHCRRRHRGGMDGGAALARRVRAGLGRERESYGCDVL